MLRRSCACSGASVHDGECLLLRLDGLARVEPSCEKGLVFNQLARLTAPYRNNKASEPTSNTALTLQAARPTNLKGFLPE